MGEVVRRVASCSLGTFFGDEIAGPLQAEFHIGTPAFVDTLIAPMVPPPGTEVDEEGWGEDNLLVRAMTNPPITAEVSWDEAWRRAEIPAGNGFGNARSMVRAQHALACGGTFDGVTLLSEEGCLRVFQEQADGLDLVLGVPVRHGMGYALNSPDFPVSPNEHACYWGGWGGSVLINDLEQRLTFAYAMNRMSDDIRTDERGPLLAFATFASLAA